MNSPDQVTTLEDSAPWALTRLYRRSRAFRVVLYLLCVPLWATLFLVSSDTLNGYTEFGNDVLLVVIIGFGAWAWWHGEFGDRRPRPASSDDNGNGREPQ